MNRLRDDAGEDPIAARGIEMLRGTPPAPRMTDLKRRVWMSIQQTDDRAAGLSRMPSVFTTGRMRAFVLVAVIVCVAGSAGAVIVGRWIGLDRRESASPSVRRDEIKTTTKRATTKTTAKAEEPAIVDRKIPVSAPATAKAATGRYAAVTGGPNRLLPTAMREPVPSGTLTSPSLTGPLTSAASARERTEVLDAMIALRRNHDPGRAGVLLDRYLVAHPQGGLHEEALALAIEAADGRDDRAAARSLARTYENRYPQGRFVRFARSHTTSNAP